jgi:uncharacterized membrane protein
MKSEGNNQPAGDGTLAGKAASFFDDRAEEKARPVVPLGREDDVDATTVVIRRPRGGLPRNLTIGLIVIAALFVGAVASYLSFRPASPSTSAEATASGASEPVSSQPEPSPLRRPTGNGSETSTGVTRGSGRGASPEVPVVPVNDDPRASEGRERDEKKLAERARKEEERRREDEKKLAEREREEAKKMDERRRDKEKRDKPKARLLGTISEIPRP